MVQTVLINEIFSIAQAAKRLPHSEPALRALYRAGRLDAFKIAGKLVVTEAELKARFGAQYQPPRPRKK